MNKLATINQLVLISNTFDKKGLYKEADYLDRIILSYAISEGLVSEAGAREFLGQIGSTIGGAVGATADLAYEGAKKITQLTWNNIIQPAAQEVASTFRIKPKGALLIALLFGAGGAGLANAPYSFVELGTFIEQNEDTFVNRVLSHAIFRYNYLEYEVQKNDNLYKIVRKLYKNQTPEFYDFAIEAIVEENPEIVDPNSLMVGQKIRYAENLIDALAKSTETVISEEIVVDASEPDVSDSDVETDEVFRERFDAMVEKEEGKHKFKYLDGEGNWTIGIGHMITGPELRRGTIKINGVNVAYGKGLTEKQMQDLYAQDRSDAIKGAEKAYRKKYKEQRGDTKWEDLKIYEKQIFEDFTFNTGDAEDFLDLVIRVEGKITGPGLSSGYSYYLANQGIWARRSTQILWSRGCPITKDELLKIVTVNEPLGKRVAVCLGADKSIDTIEGLKTLVKDLRENPTKKCPRWGF